MIKAAVVDLDGTLLDGVDVVDGWMETIDRLHQAGVKVVVASGRRNAEERVAAAGLSVDFCLTESSVGAHKGSPLWVESVKSALGIDHTEMVWIGDTDLDMRSAVNGKVIYFNAAWANPTYEYGISVDEPSQFCAIVIQCLQRAHPWYWTLDTTDASGRPVRLNSMVNGRGGNASGYGKALMGALHYKSDPKIGPLTVTEFTMWEMLGSLSETGVIDQADTWTMYPGSGGDPNKILGPYASTIARLFRDSYVDDLLVRHKRAVDSSLARYRGDPGVDFLNQINTVHVNPQRAPKIKGKTVVVVDDFTTEGLSMECARNLLLLAGASMVMGVTVGKYRLETKIITPAKGYVYDPYLPIEHKAESFVHRTVRGNIDPAAMDEFAASFAQLRDD